MVAVIVYERRRIWPTRPPTLWCERRIKLARKLRVVGKTVVELLDLGDPRVSQRPLSGRWLTTYTLQTPTSTLKNRATALHAGHSYLQRVLLKTGSSPATMKLHSVSWILLSCLELFDLITQPLGLQAFLPHHKHLVCPQRKLISAVSKHRTLWPNFAVRSFTRLCVWGPLRYVLYTFELGHNGLL